MLSDQDTPNLRLGTTDVARLLIENRPRLMAYLVSCVRNYVDAEDLFQEVSVAAIDSAKDVRSPDEFMPWAREIARRRVLAHFRKSNRLTPIDPELAQRLAETAAMLDQSDSVPARVEALYSCLESLPRDIQKLVALRYEDGRRPIEAIAAEFGRSIQATYAILKRTRILLYECVVRKLSEATQ